MNKLLDTMKKKRMPLSFLAGYLPTYILILELQTENPDISEHCINIRDILPTVELHLCDL